MSRTYSHALRAAAVLTLTASIIACGNKPSVETSGEMTQHIKFDQPDFNLEQGVKGYYQNILGRPPTQAELNQALAQLRSGFLNMQNFGTQLANSQEAMAKVGAIIQQTLGTMPNQAQVAAWAAQLANGLSLANIQQMLQQYANYFK